MADTTKPLVWLHGEVRTPPFSQEARGEAGVLLRRLQNGENLGMPQSRSMPNIGRRCHELRVRDKSANWRMIYRAGIDAIVLLEVFAKKTGKTPAAVIRACKARLKRYDELA